VRPRRANELDAEGMEALDESLDEEVVGHGVILRDLIQRKRVVKIESNPFNPI